MPARIVAVALSTLVVGACATAPKVLPPRAGTSVSASAGRAWDSAIQSLADRQIVVGSMDRAAGFFASAPVVIEQDARRVADCGSNRAGTIGPVEATDAIYNVSVRGDSSTAVVKVTAQYSAKVQHETSVDRVMCASSGAFERELEAAIKSRAEGTR
jgi:hypothetical protein